MPELPEIETLAREFQKKLPGQTVSTVSIFRETRVFKISPEILRKELPGKRIERVSRRGKFLILNLSRGFFLTFHLGMTGQLVWAAGAGKEDPHLHLGLQFEGIPEKLFFRDIRRFGSVYFWAEAGPAPAGIKRWGKVLLKIGGGELKKILKPQKARTKTLLLIRLFRDLKIFLN